MMMCITATNFSTFAVVVECCSKDVIEITCSKDKPEDVNSTNQGMV
jgi:hypothetical protein